MGRGGEPKSDAGSVGKKKGVTGLSGSKLRTKKLHGVKKQPSGRGRGLVQTPGEDREESLERSRSFRKSSGDGGARDPDDDGMPFDEKGYCVHHAKVRLASKKLRGGWKVLLNACPKCIEEEYDDDCRSVSTMGTSRSASSRMSVKSAVSLKSAKSASSKKSTASVKSLRDAPFNSKGCCKRHPTIKVATKKVFGGGWKVLKACPKCVKNGYAFDDDDARSVSSAGTWRSSSSKKSAKSAKSATSWKSTQSRKSISSKNKRFALPFDEDGYCHDHPETQLAKKKLTGGWKVILDICPDCAVTSLKKHGKKGSKSSMGKDPETSSVHSSKSAKSTGSKSNRVKKMPYTDANGESGWYTGKINEDGHPHGRGKIKYENGTSYEGLWNEGIQAHSSMGQSERIKSGFSDWSSRGYRDKNGEVHNAKAVYGMKWLDRYGDPGKYSGEVNEKRMPHGNGVMKYDHGLVQEGKWENGILAEDKDDGGRGTGGKNPPMMEKWAKQGSGRSRDAEGNSGRQSSRQPSRGGYANWVRKQMEPSEEQNRSRQARGGGGGRESSRKEANDDQDQPRKTSSGRSLRREASSSSRDLSSRKEPSGNRGSSHKRGERGGGGESRREPSSGDRNESRKSSSSGRDQGRRERKGQDNKDSVAGRDGWRRDPSNGAEEGRKSSSGSRDKSRKSPEEECKESSTSRVVMRRQLEP